MKTPVFAIFALSLLACDPVWTVQVEVNDPANQTVSGASVLLTCDGVDREGGPVAVTDDSGVATISGVGADIPQGCDVSVRRPQTSPATIPYTEMCPNAPARCERTFRFKFVVEPCDASATCSQPKP